MRGSMPAMRRVGTRSVAKYHMMANDPTSWAAVAGSVRSPFNMEALLGVDDKLLAAWAAHPFFLDLDSGGRVIVKFANVEDGEVAWREMVCL